MATEGESYWLVWSNRDWAWQWVRSVLTGPRQHYFKLIPNWEQARASLVHLYPWHSMPKDCDQCHKTEGEEESKKLFRCTRCLKRFYCGVLLGDQYMWLLNKCVCPGPECQKLDWPSHKTQCKATPHWYDKYRRCGQKEFGQKEKHEGELELITWACPEEGTGWGSCFTEESDDLRRKFEIEFGGDLEKFYKYWPQGFRWRCCGAAGNVTYGCDHHGRGKKPCSCDFCK